MTTDEFAEAWQQNEPYLRIALNTLDSPEDPEDVLQQVALRALLALHQLRERNRLRAWLHAILLNIVRAEAREGQRLVREADLCDGLPLEDQLDTRPDAVESVERSEENALYAAGVDALPEPFRQTVRLFYAEGRSTEQVAAETNAKQRTVLTRLWRGRQQLIDWFRLRGMSNPDRSRR